MAGAVELATAYLALVPSLKGASESISQQLGPASSKAGAEGGNNIGNALMGGLKKFALPIAGIVGAFSVKKFVSESTTAFMDLAGSVKGFGRIAGGSIEQYSGLRGALQMSGVDVQGATGALTIFSKNLGNAGADAAKTEAMTQKLGVSFKDASGHIKPMSDLLPGVADKFKSMPDGAEKTALAMQLFGRSGAQMLPFLNQGSAGIAGLTAKAKEMGLVLDDASMRVFGNAKASARQYTTAIEGMKVALGQTLLPVITAVANVGRQIMIPVFEELTKVFVLGRGPILGLAGHIQDFADKAGAATQKLMDKIGPTITPMLEKAGGAIGSVLEPLAPLLPKLWELGKAFSPVGTVLAQIGPVIPGIMESLIKIATVITGALGDALKTVLPVVADLIGKLATNFSKVAADALPGLQTGLEKLLPMISGITDKLLSNTSIIYGAITAWAIWSAITSAIELGGTIAGLVDSIKAWGGLITKLKEATVVQWLLNAAQKAMPFLLIIAGIALLVAGVIWAYNNIGWFKDGVDAAFHWIQDVVGAVVSWFQTDALPFLSAVWAGIAAGAKWLYENAIKPAWDGIMAAAAVVAAWYQQHLAPVFAAFGELFGAISKRVGDAWNFLWKGFQVIWAAFGQPVFDIIHAVFDVLTGHVGSSTKKSGDFWSDLWAGVQAVWAVVGPILETAIAVTFGNIAAAFKFIWDIIVAVFTFVWNTIVTVLNMALGIIQGVIEVFTGLITGNWDQVWHGIATIFGAIWDGIVNTIGNVLALIGGIISAGLGLASAVIGNILGGIARFFGDTWTNVSNGVRGFIDGLIGFFRDLPGGIMNVLSGAGSWLFSVGVNLIQGLISGVQSMIGAIGTAILSLVPGPIVGVFKDALGIHSPSRVFRGLGRHIPEGLIQGVTDMNAEIASTMTGLVTVPDAPKFGVAGSGAAANGGINLDGYSLRLNADATMATFQKIAVTASTGAVNGANQDAFRRASR